VRIVDLTTYIELEKSAANNDIEKVEAIVSQKRSQVKNSRAAHELDRLFAELEALEWLQRQIARYSLG
jgi:hypothetical protein